MNRLTGSKRIISHGLISPGLGKRNLECMHVQTDKLKIDAWKGYTGVPEGSLPEGWWLDDEKASYPMLEYSRKLKVKNTCLHKGLPLQGGVYEFWHPRDVERAAKDFPDLNFIVYHSAFLDLAGWIGAPPERFQPRGRHGLIR